MEGGSLFRMLARYNRIANERLYEACARLPDADYRAQRQASFSSIHGLLNHLLASDRVWMARFQGHGGGPRPDQVLFDTFPELRSARVEQDAAIEEFFEHVSPEFFRTPLRYTNSKGQPYTDEPSTTVMHFFNHQTHHRAQVHVMLSQTAGVPPSLDLHRIMNP